MPDVLTDQPALAGAQWQVVPAPGHWGFPSSILHSTASGRSRRATLDSGAMNGISAHAGLLPPALLASALLAPGLLIAALLAPAAAVPPAGVDYRSYLHWVSRVDAPEYATAVTVTNGFAYMTVRVIGGAATGGATGVAVSAAAGIVAVASGKRGLQLFPVQCAW